MRIKRKSTFDIYHLKLIFKCVCRLSVVGGGLLIEGCTERLKTEQDLLIRIVLIIIVQIIFKIILLLLLFKAISYFFFVIVLDWMLMFHYFFFLVYLCRFGSAIVQS